MSGIRGFKKVANASPDTQALQDRLDEFFAPFMLCSLLNGQQLKSIELVPGSANQVSHKLGREILGYIVVRNRAQSKIWDTQDTNALKKSSLLLWTDATTTIDIWVY